MNLCVYQELQISFRSANPPWSGCFGIHWRSHQRNISYGAEWILQKNTYSRGNLLQMLAIMLASVIIPALSQISENCITRPLLNMLVNIGTMHKYHIQENKQELQLPVAEVFNLDVILIILSVFTVILRFFMYQASGVSRYLEPHDSRKSPAKLAQGCLASWGEPQSPGERQRNTNSTCNRKHLFPYRYCLYFPYW